MLRRLGTWAVVFGLVLPVCAVDRPGAISGYVRDDTGTPQMGAVVEILGSAAHTFTVFTDGAGYYSAKDLVPGLYTVRVSAPSFLPAFRDRIGLRAGATLNVNLTLKTLFGAIDLGPIRTTPDDDDWKWTLRSAANRPILRIFEDPTLTGEKTKSDHQTTGTLSLLAGSAAGGYGSGSDLSTGFTLERSVFSAGRVGLSGNVGYGDGLPAAVLRASYSHALPDGSAGPSFAITGRRFAPSDPNLHNAALQALAMSAGDDLALGDVVELKFGSELQTIQFLGRVTAFRPYGSADVHLSPNTVLEYAYATALPDDRTEKGFDTSPAELSETNPRVSMVGFTPKVEHDHHHELSISRRMGKNTTLEAAAFLDHVADTALMGVGEDVTAAGGFILPDVYSGTFSYTGQVLDTNGFRVVLQRKFTSDLSATLDYAFGGALDLHENDVQLQNAAQFLSTVRHHAISAKLNGSIPRTHTRWIASYRWVNSTSLTPVDMFNACPGQSDPYLNLFIRQRMPAMGGHMEAIIDVRNLLAQGYIPVIGQDGQTVYLVQAARSVRGGFTFTF
jgi:hypothetical protein